VIFKLFTQQSGLTESQGRVVLVQDSVVQLQVADRLVRLLELAVQDLNLAAAVLDPGLKDRADRRGL
jgi:hypothetical protein